MQIFLKGVKPEQYNQSAFYWAHADISLDKRGEPVSCMMKWPRKNNDKRLNGLWQ